MVQESIFLAKNQSFVLSKIFNFYMGFDSKHIETKETKKLGQNIGRCGRGVPLKTKIFTIFGKYVISCNKTICTLQITDTTGSHQFPAMQRLSITKGHAFILVYSVCSKQSLEELKPIWSLIKELKGQDIVNIPVMLVGNKCDESAELRNVTEDEGKEQARLWNISFMETSAKTNHNVTELFQELLNLEKTRTVSLQLDTKTKKKQKKEKKAKESNGAIAENGEGDGGGSSSAKEKCLMM
ncbi:GTP-binding protein Di-Ras2 isoform X1 [Musca autumnalis]|uniref:GTP-binding protein Di-Ras2 isoform X1 n=2 Tax=Musca autumnalis TaxID=221902 RepID=UPI003CF9B5B4